MRWGVEQRLEFIEFRLFWEGGINRADIMERFGVSVPQASKDLSLYEEKAPGNLKYDKSEKRYLPSAHFKPVFLDPESTRYLSQLRTVSDRVLAEDETWLSWVPAVDTLPIPFRRISVDVLRSVLAAIRGQQSLDIRYQSMSAERPDPEWRKVSPHALANDGQRWHVRAYCHIDHKFKDFLLSRCLGARNATNSDIDAQNDTIWNQTFDIVLRPNPVLSESQRQIIAQDYDMKDSCLSVEVRKAMLYYFEKRLRLDIAPDFDSPHEIPVVIENRKEFNAALREAMA